MVNIALMGYGVVGHGVVEIAKTHKEAIEKSSGEKVQVKKILVRRAYPPCEENEKFTMDINEIISDETISVVVEAIGGTQPALSYVSACLKAGKSVVTSNKELIATHGFELMALAKENGVNLLFEASVGGAIPIIRPMNSCLAANNITKIEGILNGTTNFILTKMKAEGLSYNEALKQAQGLGYAESDPSSDVEGIDALRKICILSSMAYGRHIYPKYISPVGITGISSKDNDCAKALGGVIKLIASSCLCDQGTAFVEVGPAFVKGESLLSKVDDSFNGVKITTDNAGEVFMVGRGAGSLPTGSAVMADVIHCIVDKGRSIYKLWADGDETAISHTAPARQYFIRLENPPEKPFDVDYFQLTCQGDDFAFISQSINTVQLDTLLAKLKAEDNVVKAVYPLTE